MATESNQAVSRDVDMEESAAEEDIQNDKKRLNDATSPGGTEKKKKHKKNPHNLLYQATLRKPTWTYFHLRLVYLSAGHTQLAVTLDLLTVKSHLNAALQRFLGLHGAAIPVDILKLDWNDIWIRVPREDATAVHEAMSSWNGETEKWTVKGRDEWLSRLVGGGDGQDLFVP